MADAWKDLAVAVIEQAIRDYKRLWDVESYEKVRIKEFFMSEWFAAVTDIDPEWLIETLEAQEREKRKKANGSTKEIS